MMRILIVEDEQTFITEITEIIKAIVTSPIIHVAIDKESALRAIDENFYDLILLDLRIPITDGAETDPAHGHQVLTETRVSSSGTPIIVLTGSSAEDFLPNLIAHSEKHDVWGEGQLLQMIAFHRKHRLDLFPKLLEQYLKNIERVQSIELIKKIPLSIEEDRLIRIFSRKRNGSKCEVERVDGGFSATKVFRLKVTDSQGVVLHLAICKIGLIDAVRIENQNYDAHILRLSPEATPRKIAVLEQGAKDTSGIFYSLADGYERNVFKYLNDDPVNEQGLILAIESLTKPWHGVMECRKSIREIRERVLWEPDFLRIKAQVGLDWIDGFERNQVQTRWFCEHGDLHGLNILLSTDNIPILIDYGDVGDGPASLDPITLELSLFFHPEGPLFKSEWPTAEQAKEWGDLDKYLIDCPFPEFIRECRRWALRSSAGQREVAATAYAYTLRQWKYETTNKQRVLELLDGIRIFYDQT